MILATLNLTDGEWSVVEDGDSSSVAVGFTSETVPTSFDNLSFGWSLSVNAEDTESASYPEGDIVYVSTDQEYMVSDAIATSPDDDCVLSVWAENAGERYETSHEFVVPRPESPYASWVWDAEVSVWQAPVPMPQDDNQYTWDEDAGAWVVVTEPQA